jgi:ABC-type Fe3+ transport system substrate-binding protein
MRRFARVRAAFAFAAVACTPAMAVDEKLLADARKEGRLAWYTTQIVDQFAAPAARAFEKLYGIKVEYVRTDPNSIVLRIWNEVKAGAMQADVFDGAPALAGLRKLDLVQPYVPAAARRLPPQDFDPHGYWIGTNIYILTPARNTNLTPKGSEPRRLDDLLDPRLKGRMAWASNTFSAPGFVGMALASMGEKDGTAYLRRLATQNIANLGVSARQVLDQTIAGEYAVALATFNNHSVISAAQGAPVAWIPMDPAIAYFSVAGLTRGAPHANAGKLFLEFLIGDDGQRVLRDADYIPVDPAVPPRDASLRPDGDKFKAVWFSPEEIEAKLEGWQKLQKELFQ